MVPNKMSPRLCQLTLLRVTLRMAPSSSELRATITNTVLFKAALTLATTSPSASLNSLSPRPTSTRSGSALTSSSMVQEFTPINTLLNSLSSQLSRLPRTSALPLTLTLTSSLRLRLLTTSTLMKLSARAVISTPALFSVAQLTNTSETRKLSELSTFPPTLLPTRSSRLR